MSNNEPIDDTYVATFFEDADGTPKSRFTTPWLRTHLGFFRIDLAVVGPKSQQPKRHFDLTTSEAEDMVQAITNILLFLKEELR